MERGFEQTTIDDIVNAAGVSRRTFFRYFETKEDVAIAWNLDDDFEGHDIHFAEALAAGEPGESPLDALREFTCKSLCLREKNPDFADMVLKIEELIAKTPALRARRRTQIAQFAENVAVELAKRWEVDPERDLRPRLVANCAMAIVMTAFDAWTERSGRESRAELVDQVFKIFEIQFASAGNSMRAEKAEGISNKAGRRAKQHR